MTGFLPSAVVEEDGDSSVTITGTNLALTYPVQVQFGSVCDGSGVWFFCAFRDEVSLF